MKKFVAVLGLMVASSTAFAADIHQIDANAFKAVADALVTQYKIADDQSIDSITRMSEEAFAVKLKNEDGSCVVLRASVEVGVVGSASRFVVEFPRIAPTSVSCD